MNRRELVDKIFRLHEIEASLWVTAERRSTEVGKLKRGLEAYTKIAKLAAEIRDGIVELGSEDNSIAP